MMNSRQRGSTLFGVIFGLVAGLAVALVVAIYVTKVPVPFINRSASRTPLQDEAEAERNRNWDPNAALHSPAGIEPSTNPAGVASGSVVPPSAPAVGMVGGGVATPAAAPAATLVPAEVPQQTAPSFPLSGNVPEMPSNAPSMQARGAGGTHTSPVRPQSSRSDPLGELMASRTPSRVVTPSAGNAPASDPFLYFVQAGAFRSPQDADAQRARLSLLGVEARVSEREQSGRPVYRVRAGPYQNHDAANQVQTQLANNGFDAALVRVQR